MPFTRRQKWITWWRAKKVKKMKNRDEITGEQNVNRGIGDNATTIDPDVSLFFEFYFMFKTLI
jgi:hypothetical protein